MSRIFAASVFVFSLSIVVAISYLWGYWGTFEILIISYLSVSDVLVLSAFPLLGLAVTLLIGLSIAAVLRVESPDGTDIRNRSVKPEIIYTLSLLAIILIVIFGGATKWLLLAIPFAVFVSTYISSNSLIAKRFLTHNELYFILLATTLLPALAFGYGKTQSLLILQGVHYQVLETPSVSARDERYLGKAGEYLFSLEPESKSVRIRRAAALEYFSLSHPQAHQDDE